MKALPVILLGALAACSSPPPAPGAVSMLGTPLPSLGPEGLALEWMEKEGEAALAAWEYQPTELNAVWVGRRLAYMGRFQDAIQWYASALATFPDSYRLRRHLGHRLLTIREVDSAILILKEAKEIAASQPNRLEPDGPRGPRPSRGARPMATSTTTWRWRTTSRASSRRPRSCGCRARISGPGPTTSGSRRSTGPT